MSNVATLTAALIAGETTQDKLAAAVEAKKITLAEFAQIVAAHAQATAPKPDRGLSVKTSVAKDDGEFKTKGGCVCVYGVNSKMPVSVYADGWIRLVEFLPQILTHIATTDGWTTKPGTDRAGIKQRAADYAKRFQAALAR